MTALHVLTLFSMPLGACLITAGLLWFTRKAH